jgi:serine/threonine-protein kinase
VVLAVALWVVSLSTGGFGADNRTVPSGLTGSTQSSATAALRQLDLRPLIHRSTDATVPAGEVIRSDPAGGATVQRNSSVELWISTGVARVAVPSLASLTESAARNLLAQDGLVYGTTTTEHSTSVPKDVVVSSSPSSATTVPKGTTVDLVVSDGQVDLPDFTGRTKDDATAALEQLGLAPQFTPLPCTDPAQAGLITHQDQPAGAVAQGSSVTLQYCGP